MTDVRVLVPRVRRAIEGAGATATLSDDAVKDLVADALAEILLFTGSVFGHTLIVTGTTAGAPDEYATSEPLELDEAAVVAAQAALDYFFHEFRGAKTSERISDEAQDWEYSTSAQLLRDQLALLIRRRDEALAALTREGHVLDAYVSLLEERDVTVARQIEPFTVSSGFGGQESYDPRFN